MLIQNSNKLTRKHDHSFLKDHNNQQNQQSISYLSALNQVCFPSDLLYTVLVQILAVPGMGSTFRMRSYHPQVPINSTIINIANNQYIILISIMQFNNLKWLILLLYRSDYIPLFSLDFVTISEECRACQI